MIVAVKQECLDNPEMMRRIKVMELFGDGIMLIAEGDLSHAYEKMDSAGVDWMVITADEESMGWDILFGCTGETGRDIRGLFGMEEAGS